MLKGALTYYMVRCTIPRRRPWKRSKDSAEELLEEIGVDWEQACDRERWKEVILAAISLRFIKPIKKNVFTIVIYTIINIKKPKNMYCA